MLDQQIWETDHELFLKNLNLKNWILTKSIKISLKE